MKRIHTLTISSVIQRIRALTVAVCILVACAAVTEARPLKVHAILTSHMVLQRDKPIVIWGWADGGKNVTVRFGDESAEAVADAESGRWEIIFPARKASADPLNLVVSAGDEKVEMGDILIGDVWVANGQSNMAWSLGKTTNADFELPQANLPLLRHFRIKTNEQATLQTDIRAEAVMNEGWEVSTSETAAEFSAIGYYFGSRVQRALQIPIGVISNARGGASIESLVPAHKFDEHPLAAAYKAHVDQRIAAFDARAKALEKWQRQIDREKSKGLPEDKWTPEPIGTENLVSWDIPGMSPSDAASCYNGMFGVFKGFNIKGVLFHQGYNNAIGSNCRPERYRVLMKLMVEGWREDFNEPELPIAVIGFCAGGDTQHEDNFEELSYAGGPFIRESQRLGLADVGDPKNTAFLPAYDVQVPGLHPGKKAEHGLRAARWALNRIYGLSMFWETASLVSAELQGDEMILTFNWAVTPDDLGSVPRGFSIAGEDGKFYMAHARYRAKKDQRNWNNARSYERNIIHVWSPLVEKPIAVRYGWATSPMGNLKVNGHPTCPLPSFRTDDWDWPESEDPDVSAVGREEGKEMERDAIERCDYRRTEEARRAVEILERIKTLGRQDAVDGS
jgi:sialate O-acetylesterase